MHGAHARAHAHAAAGEWSIVTAMMSTGGNAIRVFTTLQLTHDPLLFSGEFAQPSEEGPRVHPVIEPSPPADRAARIAIEAINIRQQGSRGHRPILMMPIQNANRAEIVP